MCRYAKRSGTNGNSSATDKRYATGKIHIAATYSDRSIAQRRSSVRFINSEPSWRSRERTSSRYNCTDCDYTVRLCPCWTWQGDYSRRTIIILSAEGRVGVSGLWPIVKMDFARCQKWQKTYARSIACTGGCGHI